MLSSILVAFDSIFALDLTFQTIGI